MNLRQLRYFLEIAQLRSFTRAAEVLHVAQSALSRQVRMLEDELGVPLFDRHERGVTLTPAGELLREQAGELLRQFDSLRERVVANSAQPRGDLTVGMPPSMREMVTVPLVNDYCHRFGEVSLHVNEGISVDLSKRVQDGKLDCAVVVDLSTVPLTKADLLVNEQLYLVGPRRARLALETPVSLEFAASKPLILTTRPNSLRLVVENALATARLPLHLVADSNSITMMVDLAARGLAFGVLPYCAAWSAIRRRQLCAAPIVGLRIDWVFIYPSGRGLGVAAAAYRRLLFEHAAARIAAREWTGATLATGSTTMPS